MAPEDSELLLHHSYRVAIVFCQHSLPFSEIKDIDYNRVLCFCHPSSAVSEPATPLLGTGDQEMPVLTDMLGRPCLQPVGCVTRSQEPSALFPGLGEEW